MNDLKSHTPFSNVAVGVGVLLFLMVCNRPVVCGIAVNNT